MIRRCSYRSRGWTTVVCVHCRVYVRDSRTLWWVESGEFRRDPTPPGLCPFTYPLFCAPLQDPTPFVRGFSDRLVLPDETGYGKLVQSSRVLSGPPRSPPAEPRHRTSGDSESSTPRTHRLVVSRSVSAVGGASGIDHRSRQSPVTARNEGMDRDAPFDHPGLRAFPRTPPSYPPSPGRYPPVLHSCGEG